MSVEHINKTPLPKPGSVERRWVIFDAEGLVLGRLASRIAHHLLGKHRRDYAPHVDVGDYVIVVNADKIAVTGRKAKNKMYYRHSGYWGGLKEETFEKLLERAPTKVIEKAVGRMLNRSTRRGRRLIKNLKVYAGAEHPHRGQNPTQLKLA